MATRQAQREQEAEERRAARRGGAPEPERSSGAPRLNLARPGGGAGGGWRDRLANREPAGDAPAPAADPAREEAPRRGGYLPPHLRNAGGGSGSAPPPRDSGASSDRWARREPAPREPTREPAREPTPRAPAPSAPAEEKPSSGAGGKWVPRWKQQQN
jgi:translation initiation factor 3 subunit A